MAIRYVLRVRCKCYLTNSLALHKNVNVIISFCLFSAVSLVVVLSGALGGFVFTVAVIIVLLTCRRSHSNSGSNGTSGLDHGLCFGSNSHGLKGGSDIVTVIDRKPSSKNSSSNGKPTSNGQHPHTHHHHNRRTGAGSSSTTSTNDSGGENEGSQASNESSSAELNKVEVRTSSSLSQNDVGLCVDDEDIDDVVDGLHHHNHHIGVGNGGPMSHSWATVGSKGLHVTTAANVGVGNVRRGNGVMVAAPVPVHSVTTSSTSVGGTGNNYVHVHPHMQHQHNNNNTNNKLNSLSVSLNNKSSINMLNTINMQRCRDIDITFQTLVLSSGETR